MMFLDVEFNGFHGQTISMAIVAENELFYEVINLPVKIHPWVEKHVISVLNKEPINPDTFRLKLWHFLLRHNHEVIVADWPEDFMHLTKWMCKEGGEMVSVELQMKLIKSGPFEPELRHNALSDAIALKKWYETERVVNL